jgi:SAM-dependent methyltransferase
LTWRFLDEYLPPNGSILDVGAGTGRYALEMGNRGYTVTAVDLSPALVEECERRVQEQQLTDRVQVLIADARDLNALPPIAFDAVLMLGPLYHLVEETDRRLALGQAWDRLKPGGLVFSAFLSRFGVLADLIRNVPEWIEDTAHVRSLLEGGRRPDGPPRGGFRGYFARVPEIVPLHEAVGFETLALAGVEPIIGGEDESYNRLKGGQRRQWLEVFHEISTEPSIMGASRHVLYVGRKKD